MSTLKIFCWTKPMLLATSLIVLSFALPTYIFDVFSPGWSVAVFEPMILGSRVLWLCSRILNVPNEKNRCVILSNGNGHRIDIIHPIYHITFPLCVYANVSIFAPALSPSLQTLCLSLTLSLSVSLLVSSLPLFLCHIKMHGNLFSVIIDWN